MQFEHSVILWGLLLLPLLFLLLKNSSSSLERYFKPEVLEKMRSHKGVLSQKTRDIVLIASIAFVIIALARPIIDKGEIKVHSSDIDIIVGFDISQSMFAEDIYPNRFALAKRKFATFLSDIKEAQIGVIGFSSKAFLISPLTRDFNTLSFLVNNMQLDYVSLKGTSIKSSLEVTDNLLNKSKKKVLVLFTDGGDKKNYEEEIAYAKEKGISVFVYAIGTQKGGVIKTKQGVLKDKNGDIVIVKRNDAIKQLAIESGGAYMASSLAKNDIDAIAKNIKTKFKNSKKKERTIRDTRELFFYPLILAMLLFVLSFSSLPQRRRDA